MRNKTGARTGPCGTPCRIGEGNELVFLPCINCILSKRYEMNHCNEVLVTPLRAKRSSKIECEIV